MSGFSIGGKNDEQKKVNSTMKQEVLTCQPIKPKGCQPLKPLECDTFVKSSKEVPPKPNSQDTFVKTPKDSSEKEKFKDPFVKAPEQRNSVQELLITSKPESSLSFGYNHALKKAWKKGLLPTVTKGLYGNLLTKANLSLEHITPVSQGGRTILDNLALADVAANNARGVTPIKEALSTEQFLNYLEQFRGVKNKYINGDKYIAKMMKNAKNIWGLIK